MSDTTQPLPEPPPENPADTLLMDELRVVLGRRTRQAGEICSERLEGRTLGPYEVVERIGQGGMAQVYRARNTATDLEVALKVLKPQYRSDVGICARFEREARGMAEIQHDNIVRIFDVHRTEDFAAIVMELLPGGSLRDRLTNPSGASTRLPVNEAVTLITQAARGIGAAHARGMVHRDVKPSNLLLDGEGRVKVADFGAILLLEHTTWLTGVGQQIGTPGYMSPEQCKGERVTPASDVYSLAATLYELLTGRMPFIVEEASPFALMLKHLSEPAPDPRVFREDIPEWLAEVLQKSLGKSPDQRYQTGLQFAEALETGPARAAARAMEDKRGDTIDVTAIRQQLLQLPQRAIILWACRCARRVQFLNEDPRVHRALEMAETAVGSLETAYSTQSLSIAMSRIQALRLASLKAAYAEGATPVSPAATEAARAAAAAAACAAARCTDDAAADAAFAARSAVAALQCAQRPVKPFWQAARKDYQKLLHASLGAAGTIGLPIPPNFLEPDTMI